MENFNLEIDNYTDLELEELLSLVKPYDETVIIQSKNTLKEKLLNVNNLDINRKDKLLLFLDNLTFKLLANLDRSRSLKNPFAVSNNDYKNSVISIGNNFIIEDNNTKEGKFANSADGRLVDNESYPAGFLNPINIKTIKRAINIDTKFRPDYFLTKSTNFTITLPDKLTKVVSMRLSSVEIPLTFYALSTSLNNNVFTITDASGLHVVVIPSGNYDSKLTDDNANIYIVNAVNDAMQFAGVDMSMVVFTVDPVSGRSVFATPVGAVNPSSFTINFNVDANGVTDNNVPLLLRLGWQLGFRAASYIGEVAISEGICYIAGPQYAFVAINDYNNSSNNYFKAAFSESILSPHIIGRINLARLLEDNGAYKSGQDDNYNDSIDRTRDYFGPTDILRLTITLYDEYGRVIDLNNMDWSFVLSFICLYD